MHVIHATSALVSDSFFDFLVNHSTQDVGPHIDWVTVLHEWSKHVHDHVWVSVHTWPTMHTWCWHYCWSTTTVHVVVVVLHFFLKVIDQLLISFVEELFIFILIECVVLVHISVVEVIFDIVRIDSEITTVFHYHFGELIS